MYLKNDLSWLLWLVWSAHWQQWANNSKAYRWNFPCRLSLFHCSSPEAFSSLVGFSNAQVREEKSQLPHLACSCLIVLLLPVSYQNRGFLVCSPPFGITAVSSRLESFQCFSFLKKCWLVSVIYRLEWCLKWCGGKTDSEIRGLNRCAWSSTVVFLTSVPDS